MDMDEVWELLRTLFVLTALFLLASIVGGWMVRAFYWSMG